MGWSCAVRASYVRTAWADACVESTGMSNVFITPKGRYMFEIGREHGDGAICGVVWKYLPDGIHLRRSGSFRIEPDGTVSRAPKWLKDRAPSKTKIEELYKEYHTTV